MLDFLLISTRSIKKDQIEIFPKFVIKKSSDLMIRGGDFYAIWVEKRGLWSTDEQDALQLIDLELKKYFEQHKNEFGEALVHVSYMWDAASGMIDRWHKYCQRQMRDNYHPLDENLIFSNKDTNKEDYASKKLSYPLEAGDCPAYTKLMSILYSDTERHKLEWAIGSVVSGDSKTIQKFLVLYGAPGTGKGTILNIIGKLFDGYIAVFDAKALGSSSNSFALEAFKSNPLVAIQHDGDLSRIEDNTRLNSLVSHELMTVNEKFKSTYSNKFNAFLFLGTNKPVKITDAKSGLIRRLIDVSPSGNKLQSKEYKQLIKQVDFELGSIAKHCLDVYLENPDFYDNYTPIAMLGASNDFYNFVEDSYYTFKKENGVSLKQAWTMYKEYCENAKVQYPNSQRIFREELKNYFDDFKERYTLENGDEVRSYYIGFKTSKFEVINNDKNDEGGVDLELIDFKIQPSIFDEIAANYPAQYATNKETPRKAWENNTSKLSEINTTKLHYVKVPSNHIVIDFDIQDENGHKVFEENLKEASKWPKTYAELSKSGKGIHLHYIYTGDVSKLSHIYDDKIEIKTFNGNSSLRRKLSKCNDIPIATISSGLPLKGDSKVINFDVTMNEKAIRTVIKKSLKKEYEPGSTKCSIDLIHKVLDDAYNNGINYDVTNLRKAVLSFAANSTHNSAYCIKKVNDMKFKSDDYADSVNNDNQPLVFYDVEVFPNLLLVNWKIQGKDKKIVRMINPSPSEIENLMKMRLVGFNCRKYDNHIIYARMMGYTNEQLYRLSKRLIDGDRDAFFGNAYNVSYTDVYDFSAKKQSLKKWEIELGIHHQELGLPWDQPVPEDMWIKVAEYCDNDVLATEALFEHLRGDFLARQILADLADGSVNDTTNQLTTKIIFGKNKHPQEYFNYRDMGEVSNNDIIPEGFDDYTRFNGKDVSDKLPYGQPVFPGYSFEFGKSTYRDVLIGEGGRVYAEPGIYGNTPVLDITSQHPTSIIMEKLFGKYTERFAELVEGRIDIKHEDWELLNSILDGKLTKYIQLVLDGELDASDLAYALKIAINSVYGLTKAHFDNPFRDPRNKDNIVAKRGALFMENLRHEVQKRGFIVVHIKTDSIKIADATPEIIKFVMDYGKMYGYTFEHESTYDRICLVNDAVYIAKYKDADECEKMYGYVPAKNAKHSGEWTATGTQFQVPYVFKKLFTKEPIEFEDMCETKSVSKGTLYLDMNEDLLDVSLSEKELEKYRKLLANKDFRKYSEEDLENSIKTLEDIIAENHNYIFVGRVGQFCPIKSGCGGGVLYRENEGKYNAATGTKGYRWLESEMVKTLGKEINIDRSYYDRLCNEAIDAIDFYGDYEWFVSDDPYVGPRYDNGRPVYISFDVNDGM